MGEGKSRSPRARERRNFCQEKSLHSSDYLSDYLVGETGADDDESGMDGASPWPGLLGPFVNSFFIHSFIRIFIYPFILPSFISFLNIYLHIYMRMSVLPACVCSSCSCQKREAYSLELELQTCDPSRGCWELNSCPWQSSQSS